MGVDDQEKLRKEYDKKALEAPDRLQEKLGVVTTPTEVVDFINRSINQICQKEFGKSVSDDGVKILDPFTGTGIFLARMIETEIESDKLEKKIETDELEGYEIVPEGAEIAKENLENVIKDKLGKKIPFDGIKNIDTFEQ